MTSERSVGRLLPLLHASGHQQMALDQLLLDQAPNDPVLRFYRWSGPWLSLGRNQHRWPSHWNDLAASGKLSLVRRPSGGQAVLHAGGLTYALIWPKAPRQRQQAYQQACGWLIEGFRTLGEELRFGERPAVATGSNCFARSTSADLVDSRNVKRIGSAQRWQHGCLLQHGEILLDPPAELWERVFEERAPMPAASTIPRSGLDLLLTEALQQQWSHQRWAVAPLKANERQELLQRGSSSTFWARIDATT